MQNDKSPRNDGLTKKFYENFWDDIKEIFLNSGREAKEIGHLSTSQRKVFIKLIEKKDRDKRFTKKLVTNFIVECRLKNNIKSSFRETK